MDETIKLLSTLMSPANMAETQAEAQRSFQRDLSIQRQNLSALPPDPSSEENSSTFFKYITNLRPAQLLESSQWREMTERCPRPRFPPPTTLPCANVQVAKYTACKNPGTMACSRCKLVSYCSKECQQAHWKRHKEDCKNSMMSGNWKPIWITERRPPSFLTDTSETDADAFRHLQTEEFSIGMSLWGNTPAVDLINIACNENDPKKDFSLAFIASGDLRHVLRSFNGLPSDYSGHLNILVNDMNPFIFCRNIVLLLILANVSDEVLAADMALHFWYSAFLPGQYRLQLSMILSEFMLQMKSNSLPIPLGPHATLSTFITKDKAELFTYFISSSLSIGDIQKEYNRVRTAPSRCDYRDKMYQSLKPSHRVAFQVFRRFGIVLPFGAPNAHFNDSNLSLFSPEGKWLQTDYADPLEGWDMSTIVDTGKAYGAHPEDIYGCLYFFLSKELRTFASRLRRFSSSFTVLPYDARELSGAIRDDVFSELNVPSSIRFDRIEVSNILDENYVGLRDVLTLWGPFLHESKSAAIVGYLMNWAMLEKNGRAISNNDAMASLTPKIMEKEMVRLKGITPNFSSPNILAEVKEHDLVNLEGMMHASMDNIEALYENSEPFFKYLRRKGLEDLLRKTKLKLRNKHTIVPHRILAPLKGGPKALPEFPDDDTWYYYTKLTNSTWSERYVEFIRA